MKEKNAKKYYSLSMVLCFALIKVILNYYNERIVKSSCKEHALHLKQIGGGGGDIRYLMCTVYHFGQN